MTLFLAICLLMVIVGAACIGWVLRQNLVSGDDAVDPRDFAHSNVSSGASS